MNHIVYVTPAEIAKSSSITAPMVAIKVGESGYYPIHCHPRLSTYEMNYGEGISEEIKEAAIAGSMFGWHVPAAKAAVAWAAAREAK